MKPINEFPYGNDMRQSNPIHKKMMLFQMKSPALTKFAFGYYDAVDDVFQVCMSPFMNTESHRYDDQIAGKYNERDSYCIMPNQFIRSLGSRRILAFMEVEDALEDMHEAGLVVTDISTTLDKSGYMGQYLLCFDDDRLVVSDIGCFVDIGKQFSACTPTDINGNIYHAKGAVPRERIRFAVDLLEWKELRKWQTQ